MFGVVHVNQGFQPVAGTELLPQRLLKITLHQHRARVIEKAVIVLADIFDVLVFAEGPERLEVRVLDVGDRVVLPQVAEQGMHAGLIAHDDGVQQVEVAVHVTPHVRKNTVYPYAG